MPVATPLLDGKEIEYVLDCLKTNWISSKGKYVEEFEKRFAKFINAKHGITTTSGTTALHLALAALKIGRGDEVILPDFTMIACADAVVYTGARPVFVDVEPRTWNIDPTKIEKKITDRQKLLW